MSLARQALVRNATQKPASRAAERQARNADKKALERQVYRQVDARDQRRCRACGKVADPQALDMTRRGHHHHIVRRSAGGKTTTANIATLCAADHADVHAYRLTITGDANKTLKVTRC